jgi:hypothetical protein
MRMTEQLIALGECWSDASKRSLSRLATRVQNDSKFFDRLAQTGTCTTATFEKFLTFFRDAANWPDAVIPQAAAELLDNFENIASAAAAEGEGPVHAAVDSADAATASTGCLDEMSRQEQAA